MKFERIIILSFINLFCFFLLTITLLMIFNIQILFGIIFSLFLSALCLSLSLLVYHKIYYKKFSISLNEIIQIYNNNNHHNNNNNNMLLNTKLFLKKVVSNLNNFKKHYSDFNNRNIQLIEELNSILDELIEIYTLNSIISGKMVFQKKRIDTSLGNSKKASELWDKLEDHLETQADTINISSTSVYKMINALDDTVGIAEQLSLCSNELLLYSDKGKIEIHNSIESIGDISKISGELNEIVILITDILSKTDVLAINASIEAAHSGDKGRGFSVIADQIKKLAVQTTENIKQIIDKLRDNDISIKKAVEISNTAGVQFNNIYDRVKNVVKLIKEIDSSSKKHTAGSKKLLNALSLLKHQTEDIKKYSFFMKNDMGDQMHEMNSLSNIARETMDSSDMLDKSLEDLKQKITDFKELINNNNIKIFNKSE